MKQRWLVGIVGVPALLAVLLACPVWATVLLAGLFSGIAAYELLHTAGKCVPMPAYVATVASAVLQVVLLYWEHAEVSSAPSFADPFRYLLVVVLFFIAIRRYGTDHAMPFSDVAVALLGGIVFPAMYSAIVFLRLRGAVCVLAPFVIAFIGDSFSMYAGMLFGKAKLLPAVSPHKTWAGAIAGPVGAALGMLLLGFAGAKLWSYAPNYAALAAVGAVANAVGQIGDLSMSLVKREVGIKDYSHLFLSHGGMLDRFDSTLFIAPLVWLFVAGGAL